MSLFGHTSAFQSPRRGLHHTTTTQGRAMFLLFEFYMMPYTAKIAGKNATMIGSPLELFPETQDASKASMPVLTELETSVPGA